MPSRKRVDKEHGDIFAGRLNISDWAAMADEIDEADFYDWLNKFRPTYILNAALFHMYMKSKGGDNTDKYYSSGIEDENDDYAIDYASIEQDSEWGRI